MRCRVCGAPAPSGRLLCGRCMDAAMACRAALRALLAHRFLEPVGEHAWLIRPGARGIADLLYWTEPARFGYREPGWAA